MGSYYNRQKFRSLGLPRPPRTCALHTAPHMLRGPAAFPEVLAAPSSLQGAPWATLAPPPAIRFVSGNRLLSVAPDWLRAKTQFSAQSSCISGPLSLSLPPTSPLIAICSVISFSNPAEHREAAAWESGREEGKRAPVPCSKSAGPGLCPVSCVCVCVCVCVYVCVYLEPDRHEHVVIQPTTRPLQGQTRASTCTRPLSFI